MPKFVPRTDMRGNGPDEIEGYNQESFLPAGQRFGAGWGGSQTRLKKGHLARRDGSNEIRETPGTKGS